mgnify:CR=1 FL=1
MYEGRNLSSKVVNFLKSYSKTFLKLLITLTISAMGFLLGMVLADVNGVSAETMPSFFQPSVKFNKKSFVETKTLNQHWADTQIGLSAVFEFISNQNCYSSELYFQACLNSIVQNAVQLDHKISKLTGKLVQRKFFEQLDEKTEKQLLTEYLNSALRLNFDELILKINSLETAENQAQRSANLINSFFSVYFDPHTYILPTEYYEFVSNQSERTELFLGMYYEKFNGVFQVTKILKNSDVDRAGIKAGDHIVSINEERLRNKNFDSVNKILKNPTLSELKI